MESDKSNSKMRGLLWVAVVIILAGLAAGGLPLLAKKTPWSWEVKASEQIGRPGDLIIDKDPAKQKILEKLLKRIYPLAPEDSQFTISLSVVQKDQINAFASLGGQIFINSKLIQVAQSPEELAAVIAHEIGHVQHRHIFQGIFSETLIVVLSYWSGLGTASTDTFRRIMGLNFSRKQEAEADHSGLLRLQAAKVNTQGMIDFFSRLQTLDSSWELLSDHPSSSDRAEAVRKTLNNNKDTTPILSNEEWKKLKSNF